MTDPQDVLHDAGARFDPLTSAVTARVRYSLPEHVQERFRATAEAMRLDRLPPALERLTFEGGSRRDWLNPMRGALLHHVPEGLKASHYHLDAIRRLESDVVGLCTANLPDGDGPVNGVTVGMSLGPMNFEYQAFRFALRRTLEYLAVGVSAFFKAQPGSFAHLDQALRGKEPADTRERVLAEVGAVIAQWPDMFQEQTVRDRIAHWEAVDAGVLNILWREDTVEIGLAGGGENLFPFRLEVERRRGKRVVVDTQLTSLLEAQVERVEEIVFRILGVLGLPS